MSAEQQFLDLYAAGFERANRADLRGANQLYERALVALGDLDHPQLTGLLANLAQNALALGDTDQGWEYFDRALTRALAIGPHWERLAANTWHQFAWILYERGDLAHAEQALELIDRALVSDDRLETHDTKLRILLKLGRDDEARQVAVAALHRDFSHRDFQDIKLRWALTSQRAVAAAWRALSRSTPVAPTPRAPRAPRPKRIDELRAWKGQRPSPTTARRAEKKEPQLDLAPTGANRAPRARAQEVLRRHLRSSQLLTGERPPLLLGELAAIAGDPARGAYAQVDAALGLVLLGDRRALPVLRRVLAEPMFALSSSLHEQGLAALGLALLGDVTQLARIRLCPRLNFNAITVELAIEMLEELAYGSR